MLTPRWYPLRPHEMQSRLWRTSSRDVKVWAGRGSGKTELARRRIVRLLRLAKPWRDPRYFYAMPTYGQCKRVAREHILQLIPPGWLTKHPGDSKMEFKTVFGTWLFLVGMDRPERLEGDQYDAGIIDEACDQKAGIYPKTIRPALTHRFGALWRVGVPKRTGPGAREFRQACEQGIRGEDAFNWPSWDILSQHEIEKLARELPEKDYNEQIGGRWEDAGGAAYYAFLNDLWPFGNLEDTKACDYDKHKPIYVSCDFNVDPMAWILAHRAEGDQVSTAYATEDNDTYIEERREAGPRVFDEIWLRNTNTQQTLDYLWNKYGEQHRGGWIFCGDATSRARKTSASKSDYQQIRNDARFKARIKIDKSNPSVKDRLSSVNAMLRNKAGNRRLLIHPRCTHLIEDLMHRALDENGNPTPAEPGLAHDSGHISDALGYFIHKYYPIKGENLARRLILVGDN